MRMLRFKYCYILLLVGGVSLLYTLKGVIYHTINYSKLKTVYIYGDPASRLIHNFSDLMETCNHQHRCQLVHDPRHADALLFDALHLPDRPPVANRPREQIWVYYFWDNPRKLRLTTARHNFDKSPWRYVFNWTASYLRIADIHIPFGRLVDHTMVLSEIQPDRERVDLSLKTKFAFFYADQCDQSAEEWHRMQPIKRFMDVDVYGQCGNTFPYSSHFEASIVYFFYLANEVSMCKDYITDVFWNNFNQSFAIPVVFGGASIKDYLALVPQDSFVYAPDFDNPKKLATYLKKITLKPSLYESYFSWKNLLQATRVNISQEFVCAVCEKLNTDTDSKIVDIKRIWKEQFC